jgi:hypothetical protein
VTEFPSAVFAEVESGAVYLLPYHGVGNLEDYVSLAIASVAAHREGGSAEMPSFLGEVLVPGEEEIRAELAELDERAAGLREHEADLVRHKLLIAHLSGSAPEARIIDALNFVFAGSDLEAVDIEETSDAT